MLIALPVFKYVLEHWGHWLMKACVSGRCNYMQSEELSCTVTSRVVYAIIDAPTW